MVQYQEVRDKLAELEMALNLTRSLASGLSVQIISKEQSDEKRLGKLSQLLCSRLQANEAMKCRKSGLMYVKVSL